MPAERRDDVDLAASEEFGNDHALTRLRTNEFGNLRNQEYNLMVFLESRTYQLLAWPLFDELEAYRIELEDE